MSKVKKIAGSVCSVTIIIGIVLAEYSEDLRISEKGLELIGNAESCRTEPYNCPAGVLTVGIGSTGNVENKRYSEDEIAQRWVADLKIAEQCVINYANGDKLPQSVFDATVSITFNVGCKKMRLSTLYKYLKVGEYISACNEFPRWNKSAGKELKGLTIRREKEKVLCLRELQ